MPIDKKHPPAFYPKIFRIALMALSMSDPVAIHNGTKASCKTEARRFRAFIASCQEYPLSPEYKRLLFVVARTRIKQQEDGSWACFVFVKEKLNLVDRIENAIDL